MTRKKAAYGRLFLSSVHLKLRIKAIYSRGSKTVPATFRVSKRQAGYRNIIHFSVPAYLYPQSGTDGRNGNLKIITNKGKRSHNAYKNYSCHPDNDLESPAHLASIRLQRGFPASPGCLLLPDCLVLPTYISTLMPSCRLLRG